MRVELSAVRLCRSVKNKSRIVRSKIVQGCQELEKNW